MRNQTIAEKFRSARTDPALAVLEGFHPLKHAIRFGAQIELVVGIDPEELAELGEKYAPDVAPFLNSETKLVSNDVFRQLAPVPPPTGVIGIARRPAASLTEMLGDQNPAPPAPVVLLENPRNMLNIGAAIRVAAAAGAAGLITTGNQDPWHPAALIASAGLHYALPVARAQSLPMSKRPLVVIDPEGETLRPGSIPANAVLAFGAERKGVTQGLIASADRCVSIPMSDGISSLNLATAVAVVLYTWKLGPGGS